MRVSDKFNAVMWTVESRGREKVIKISYVD